MLGVMRRLKKKNMLLEEEKKLEQQVLEEESRDVPSQKLGRWSGLCRLNLSILTIFMLIKMILVIYMTLMMTQD